MRQVFCDDVVMDSTAAAGSVMTGSDACIGFLQSMIGDVLTVHHGHMPEIEMALTRLRLDT